MKQGEMAVWLRYLIVFTAVVIAAFMGLAVPQLLWRLEQTASPSLLPLLKPCMLFFWVTSIPAFIALGKAWQICGAIADNKSFSRKNAALLWDISKLCLLDSLLYLIAAVFIVYAGFKDIFVLLLFFGFVFLGVFIAVVSAALSHLTEKASAIEQENDLTI